MKDDRSNASSDEFAVPATPEDVAILYSWANLPGAKYRDFSASRREHRAQQRARQAEEQRQTELASARALQEAARWEMEQARQALDCEGEASGSESKSRAEEAFRVAQKNAQREQEEAGRRQQSAETLRLRAQAARKEMMDARRRAEEQAARYAEFDAQYREQVQERGRELPGQLEDPYHYTGQVDPAYFAPTPGVRTSQAMRTSTERRAYVFPMRRGSDQYNADTLQDYRPGTTFAPSPAQDYRTLSPRQNLAPHGALQRERHRAQDSRDEGSLSEDEPESSPEVARRRRSSDTEASLESESSEHDSGHDLHLPPRVQHLYGVEPGGSVVPRLNRVISDPQPARVGENSGRREGVADLQVRTRRHPRVTESSAEASALDSAEGDVGVPPAWLTYQESAHEETQASLLGERVDFAEADPLEPRRQRFSEERLPPRSTISAPQADQHDAARITTPSSRSIHPRDTLQGSRERVAARWFALQGLMGHESQPKPTTALPRATDSATGPLLVVLALSGGVGRTSMVATLGRTLSALGETVLLADTNTHGLLPYYFGARDLWPGAVRTFTPPPGSLDAPILMAHYDLERIATNEAAQDQFLADLLERSATAQRSFIDLGTNGIWLLRRLLPFRPFLLVPLKPDMNSVLSMQALEQLLSEVREPDGRSVRPWYVLNQYDPALPLHLDIREVLRQSLGDRLLSTTVHRSPAVAEALAEGMTVIDYAPGSAVAQDYMHLAEWLQSFAPSSTWNTHGTVWSER